MHNMISFFFFTVMVGFILWLRFVIGCDWMILCNHGCIPCCDFCIYAIHEYFTIDGKMHKGGPIGCSLHKDEEHQEIADSCGFCNDFHCFHVK